jgi:hypothetical protein
MHQRTAGNNQARHTATRIGAAFIHTILIATLLFATAFIALRLSHEHDHNGVGSCATCVAVIATVDLIKTVSVVAAGAAGVACLLSVIQTILIAIQYADDANTLIRQKVRINC